MNLIDESKQDEKQPVDISCGDIIYPSQTLSNSILKYKQSKNDTAINDTKIIDENILHSTDNSIEVKLIFSNKSNTDLYLYWINYDGDIRVPPTTIKTNNTKSINSFITHPFIISSSQTLENFKDIIAVYIPRNISYSIHNIIINSTATKVKSEPGKIDKSQRKIWTIESYEKYVINGFTIYFEKELLNNFCGLLHVLNEDLNKINNLVPCSALKILHSTPIWLNDNYLYYDYETKTKDGKTYVKNTYKPKESMCFHPDMDWLKKHGNLTHKAECVEIYRVKDWIKERGFMPMVLLHELAHSYHWYIDFNHKAILNAYNRVKNSKELYRNIPFILGGKRDAYALTNQMEYFAELTESYFGLNDFYPFNKSELMEYDEVGYKLMEMVWSLDDKTLLVSHRQALKNRKIEKEKQDKYDKAGIYLEPDISRVVSV